MRWLDGITDSMHMSLMCSLRAQALRDGEGQGSLECYSPWDRKELDKTERLHFIVNHLNSTLKDTC